jgi:hypothetical protein
MPTTRKRRLRLADILAWATRHRESTGKWPTRNSGAIPGTLGITWAAVDAALHTGTRGLPSGSSLAQLLHEKFAVRNIQRLPPLTEVEILAWADAHQTRTGSWPTADSGAIPNSSGEKWLSVDTALRLGLRGLPGGSSLAQLLAQHRGVRNRKDLPPLTEEAILAWADAHRARTGSWPHARSGPIAEAPGETWTAVDMALRHGLRGLPGDSSLALLLAERRAVRNAWGRPNLSSERILALVDAHHQRTGQWPNLESGAILEAPGETWVGIDQALKHGWRGLPGGSSLVELLAVERGVRNRVNLPHLNRKRILQWAVVFHRRTGAWPTAASGPIPEAPGDTWNMIDEALRYGRRGLRGGSSLARLLDAYGKKRNHAALPRLSYKRILAWADAHYRRTGAWPNTNSGVVMNATDERWDRIDDALRVGSRGLPGGSSLLRLLVRKRGVRTDHGRAGDRGSEAGGAQNRPQHQPPPQAAGQSPSPSSRGDLDSSQPQGSSKPGPEESLVDPVG